MTLYPNQSWAQEIDDVADRFDEVTFDINESDEGETDTDLAEFSKIFREVGNSLQLLLILEQDANAPPVEFQNKINEVIDQDLSKEQAEELQLLLQLQKKKKSKPFSFSANLPFTYNTNVANDPTNGLRALHANPSLGLSFRDVSGIVRPYVSGRTSLDLFTEHSENDISVISGNAGIQIHAKNDLAGFVPYLEYAIADISGGVFENHIVTLHNFTVGFDQRFKLDKGEYPVSLNFRVNVTRREASSPNAERNQLTLRVVLGQTIPDSGDKWSWSLSQQVQGRFFTNGTNRSRDDVNLRTAAAVRYKISERANVNLGMTFLWNISNVDAQEFTKFQVGPTLGFTTKF